MLEALDRSGSRAETLVVFASDHGNHFRTRNLEYKRSPHDASLRIPLVISGPGFRGGTRRSDLVTNLDLLPTVVAAGGGSVSDLDGRPLQTSAGAPDDVFVQISESQIGRALRTPTHTYAVAAPGRNPFAAHRSPDAATYVETFLYDNLRDPHQLVNLVRDPATARLRRRLSNRLLKRIRQVEETEPTIVGR